jgi:hypothetical protein
VSAPVSHAPRAIIDLLAILNHAPIGDVALEPVCGDCYVLPIGDLCEYCALVAKLENESES